ncbi:hypothetical protein BDN70DRAFT_989788 [Pholiota conissans]|uniref:Uncharacterized protein n=1 Tax=Pholiota conissans TaxID=109636 RepID=A0A9P5ZC33_9AGAR|nr:hypothetical protein BDN70DRAFT_989788 [Pholiota conissans]
MFKSLAFASLLATVALAQSSASTTSAATTSAATTSAATPSSTANPLIPSGISSGCSSFLTTLNSATDLNSCLSTLSNATSAFAPGSSNATSSASVTSALNSLCSSSVSDSCPESLIRSKLTSFFTSCSDELTTSPVAEVVKMYDVLYAFLPMKTAACSKGDDGSWCVMAPATTSREISNDVGSSSTSLKDLLSFLYTDNSALKRRATVSAIEPNTTTYHDTNLPFLFLKPSLDATTLCTTCARNVLTAYINFESNIPYAPGLSNSQILSSQTDLYNAIQDKCPSGFLSGAVQAAGGLSSGSTFMSAAVPAANSEYKTVVAAAMGMMTFAISFAL